MHSPCLWECISSLVYGQGSGTGHGIGVRMMDVPRDTIIALLVTMEGSVVSAVAGGVSNA